jgi:hypothetical protein
LKISCKVTFYKKEFHIFLKNRKIIFFLDLPNAFWKRKHDDLLYDKSFNEKQILTKARSIQMNAELE